MKPYYEQDGITIYHGDCREVMDQWEGLRTQSFDLLLTDPPYGYKFDVNWGKRAELAWDRESHTAAEGVRMARFITRSQIIWGGNYYQLPVSRGWLIWRKPDRVPSAADVEMAWTSIDMNARVFDWSIAATNAERLGHPTQKPEQLMLWCVGFVPHARTVIDPFMGSGTTLAACKRRGLSCVGIETEERYCEIAAKRLAQGVLPLDHEVPAP